MNHWHKVRTVATFEFLSAVKRRGYLIATFGMPVFMALYGAIVGIPAYFMAQKQFEPAVYGIVDPGNVLRLGDGAARDERDTRVTFRKYATEGDARSALLADRIKSYFVLPADYLQRGGLESYVPDSVRLPDGEGRDTLTRLLRQRLLAGRVDEAIAARVVDPAGRTRRFAVQANGALVASGGASTAVRIVVPVIFMVFFLLSVLMTSGFLLQGTATEKENKVVDVLLASANPDEVLAGKLLGLGAAGLLQIVLWVSLLFAGGAGIVPMLIAARVEVPWVAAALALPLFLESFLFFGSLMMGTGSLGSNMREAQQLAMVWSLTAALPLMMMGPLIQDPHGTFARVLTWIPLTSAAVVVLRASMDAASLAWWEVAGAVVVLGISTWMAIRFGARLFRVGLLSSGARPSLREILRQARL